MQQKQSIAEAIDRTLLASSQKTEQQHSSKQLRMAKTYTLWIFLFKKRYNAVLIQGQPNT
jgi:hypothetical protein